MTANPHLTITPAMLNRAFVYSGVARFARLHLAEPSPVFDQLEAMANLSALLGLPEADWNAALTRLALHGPQLPGPFGQMLRDYQLQLHEWFALALCGEIEASYWLNLALAELQTPASESRPGLYLLESMSRELFDAPLSPLAFPNHRLVKAGILEIRGEVPLPLRHVSLAPELWSLLCGNPAPWTGTRPLIPGYDALPADLQRELPLLANQLQQGQTRVLVFRGSRQAGLAAAAALSAELGLLAIEIRQEEWSSRPSLATACHYGSWLPVLPVELGPGERYEPDREQLLQTPLILVCGHDGSVHATNTLEIDLPSLTREERLNAWQAALAGQMPEALAEHALVDGPTILALAERIRFSCTRNDEQPGPHHLRSVRAQFGSERLRMLAQPIKRHVEGNALILPLEIQAQFDELVLRCQRRECLWEGLGTSLSDSALGVRALFAGESGAGKTLAASRLATILGAPLFRVDLAAVMNKYIGESEKNLGRVLDEAAALDAILLMDEADALFGRRSDGKETGERYANMLTNYLLTRIEIHSGIVILTSNSRSRIDAAFTRRFDSIVEFPLPGVEERYRLWISHLGSRAPDDQVCRSLASYCELAGGHIRNIVLNAAARDQRAAENPVAVAHLLEALRAEYRKLGRSLPPQLEQLAG